MIMNSEPSARHSGFALIRSLAFLAILSLTLLSCSVFGEGAYEENFDRVGTWGTGTSSDVEGRVNNGVYEMFVKSNQGVYMATGGQSFADGMYELEATQIEGPLNNGYGLLFRVNEKEDSFYTLEVSGDGYIWIGYCTNLCESESEADAIVGGDWFRSPAVKTGLHETNNLKVITNGSRMTFFVNGLEVGRAVDNRLAQGDVAVMVETLGQPGVRVIFDNLSYTPQ